MSNTFSLGSLQLVAVNTMIDQNSIDPSSTNIIGDGCIHLPTLIHKLFPYLIDYFNRSVVIGKNEISSKYPLTKDEFLQKLEKEVVPKLKTLTDVSEINTTLKDLFVAYPKSKKLIEELMDDLNSQNTNGSGVFALPIIGYLIAAVVVYGVGYGVGYLLS